MIFGTAAPKFKAQDGEIVLLDYSKILTDRPIYSYLEQISVINGNINHIDKGYWWEYIVRIHVFKESESIAKANKYYSYLGQDVYLYRHREAEPFKDENGNDVLFRIQEVTPSYLETSDYKDIIDIKFKSSKFIDASKTILPENVLVDSSGKIITDSDGKYTTG